ncbi:glutamate--tRNA ligase [Microlunatus sp. Gsoil 973]|uniref:glutamate--tRNA ligase n=1 Tax=Microlunatus sp. Gsoil 973 TaxID=2672569 RepID=UPI00351B3AA8
MRCALRSAAGSPVELAGVSSDRPAPLTEADVLGDLDPTAVRVRFPPSPTGNLHVGNVRSALFNWAFARHHGGTLVLRIEDTDTARNQEGSLEGLIDALRWLGLDWDEGPEVGGPYAPYVQTQRFDIYAGVVGKLLAAGHAYKCWCTREEIEERHKVAGRTGPAGYDGFCRDLTAEQIAAREAAGTPAVVRVRVPDMPIDFVDLVRGPVHFEPDNVPDYVIVRADGSPPLHADQSHRRRADGDHPRTARGGPALLDAAADRALPGLRTAGHRPGPDTSVRPPADRVG